MDRSTTPRAHALSRIRWLVLLACGSALFAPAMAAAQQCTRNLTAEVVALDQVIYYNRMGAWDPYAMMYALREDVVPINPGLGLTPGNVKLRSDKRPRPLTLRMNVGDCLEITFTNLLGPRRGDQPATRAASLHAMGVQVMGDISSDGSYVGRNPTSGEANPGETRVYRWYADHEGTYLMSSTAAMVGGQGEQGSFAKGLFGALNVEPAGSEWYRAKVSNDDMQLATIGRTPAGQPLLDYQNARYPAGHVLAGRPVLAMLDGNRIVHGDLDAVITGPNLGPLPVSHHVGVYQSYGARHPYDRSQPFREFTVIFHDEAALVQAFPAVFDDPYFKATLAGGRDAFAINYGTGGIGAEVLANRLGVGPMFDCPECKLEEFFLTSWAVGDPAMPVDVPANAATPAGALIPGPKATRALYPGDPSNVHHGYLGDRTVFRNLHAGAEHHIFHLHAHQWLHEPNSDESSILDSQSIGPGGTYTYEIAWGGSGNRNLTPGDAIFHCHFYPHFAQGMWELWRTHDVFEEGTPIDPVTGLPLPGARTLPDGEIAAGTPIPGVVPLPGKALAPMPSEEFQGFPFYIAGVPGHRPPKAPLDTPQDPGTGEYLNGGLPRHVIVSGAADPVTGESYVEVPPLNLYDFSKVAHKLVAVELPEEGTPAEQRAMAFHAQAGGHASFRQVGLSAVPANFLVNGMPPKPGAPYADPCVKDDGTLPPSATNPRIYKGASFETNAIYTKTGWFYPQHRMYALWADVKETLEGRRAPEPFFFRANTDDCVQYHYVNLVPHEMRLDDFQVRTPTDIIGQHIHLLKFDVTAADGSANGWNYEDGNFAPGETRERVHAINAMGGIVGLDGTQRHVEAKAHPYFGDGPHGEWIGAQETIQRWFADDVLNMGGKDRTLRNIFTHDHFGPSTFQQAGLYASFVIEPKNSTWTHPETGEVFGTRFDGGPTSFQAIIEVKNAAGQTVDAYREFNMMFQDFALGYYAGANLEAKQITDPRSGWTVTGWFDPANAINPPGKAESEQFGLISPFRAGRCHNGVAPPCPEIISVEEPGFSSVNFRAEPLALRIRDPYTNSQAGGKPGDLSYVFQSRTDRADPALNTQPSFPGFQAKITNGVLDGDPFTPLLRAYETDKVQVRMQSGAHEESHNLSMHGVKWLYQPSDPNSGYRASTHAGISEQFVFVVPAQVVKGSVPFEDYLYQTGSSTDDLWGGAWGLLRAYDSPRSDLIPLPNNRDGKSPNNVNSKDFKGVCPAATVDKVKGQNNPRSRNFGLVAVLARDVLPNGTLVYNSRDGYGGPLHDPTAILYVHKGDLDSSGKLKPGVPVEPLILRANAGDCIDITLENRLPETMPDLHGWFTLPMVVDLFNANQVRPSSTVGLHASLVAADMSRDNGALVGGNPEYINQPVQVAGPGSTVKYRWYAGDVTTCTEASDEPVCAGQRVGTRVATPIEFGAINLTSSDVIKHEGKGALGALIIEPEGSTWEVDPTSRAQATITRADGTSFREGVLVLQSTVNLRQGPGNGTAVENLAGLEDPEDSGQKAFNYRTEPAWFRMGYPAEARAATTMMYDFSRLLHNSQVGGLDPQTPIFTAQPGQPFTLRVLKPAGSGRNHVLTVHGHRWQNLPHLASSTRIGENGWSQWRGSQDGIGPTSQYNFVLGGAGGAFGVKGDYLIRDMVPHLLSGGLWAILRVCETQEECSIRR